MGEISVTSGVGGVDDVGVEHLAYPKIGTVGVGDAGGAWIATEKLHGAQLVVATDGHTTRVGKRKAWLRDDEPFFGWQLLRERLVAAALAALPGPGHTVRLYGELYGGSYPHPEVPPTPGVSAVQTGVWYSPDLRFALFDILVDDAHDRPYAALREVAAAAELDVVPLLRRGPRPEVEAVPTRFATTVPESLGLPPIAGNVAEGVVIRADTARPAGRRPIVKRKIAEFDEQRYAESRPFDEYASLNVAELLVIAGRLVNRARLASARSKVGTDPAAVADEVVLDVLVDLTDAYPAAMVNLDAAGEAALHEHVLRACGSA
jgi:Rnl2 family RNA ligase